MQRVRARAGAEDGALLHDIPGQVPGVQGADGRALANGAHTLTRTAPAVLGGEEERAEDRADLAVAQKVDVDIEGMTVFLMSQEII